MMLKNEKGISLVTAIMSVMIMIIILSTLVYSTYTNIKVRNLNKLYNDIRTLNDEVAVYYLENNKLPVESTAYTMSSGSVTGIAEDSSSSVDFSFVTNDGETFSSSDDLINPNDYDAAVDGAVYYYLDLSLFDNITLNYDGAYIINEQSHMIYYVKGVEVNGKTYHCIPLDYEDTQYNVYSPVGYAETEYVYLQYDGSYNLEEAFAFYSDDTKAEVGTPKKLNYEITGAVNGNDYSTYFDLSDDGIITSVASEDLYAAITSGSYFTLTVTATNYDSSYANYACETRIYLTNIKITSDASSSTSVESYNLLQDTATETTFYVQKYADAGDLSVNYTTTAEDGEIGCTLDGQVLSIIPKVAGRYVVTVSEGNGGTSKSIIINVLNPTIEPESLTFTSLAASSEELTVSIEGLDDVDLVVTESWFVSSDAAGADVLSDSNDIILLSASDLTATVSPVGFGTVYVNCQILIDGEEFTTVSVPVTVTGIELGKLYSYDGSKGSEISSIDVGDSAILDYEIDGNLGNSYTLIWSSSSTDVATVDATSGIITGAAAGVTTITATLTVGSATYIATFSLTVN